MPERKPVIWEKMEKFRKKKGIFGRWNHNFKYNYCPNLEVYYEKEKNRTKMLPIDLNVLYFKIAIYLLFFFEEVGQYK